MMPFIAFLLAVLAPSPAPRMADSQITALSVAPAAGRTEVVIRVEGEVKASDFMLDDGRLVIDIAGATHSAPVDQAINRGGVNHLRISQYQRNVVRVVFVLSQRLQYDIAREAGALRVSFPNPAGSFEPWTTSFARTAAPVPTTSAPSAPVTRQQPQQAEPISVIYDGTPVREVLADFANIAGITILPAEGIISKNITATINNLPWDVALRSILETNGMVMRTLSAGVMMVELATAVTEREKAEPPTTEQFRIEYVSADSIAEAVRGVMGADAPANAVAVNRSSNALIVTGSADAIARVRALLPQLDVLTPQVDIEAKIAFVDRTTLEQLGVVYDLKDSQGTQLTGLATNFIDTNNDGELESTEDDVIMLGGNSIAAIGNAQARVANPTLRLAMTLLLGRHSLITFLEALQNVSLTDIEAKPMIRTLDHRKAEIQVGEDTPIRVIDAGSNAGGNNAPQATVEFRPTGVILEVTPHITGNQVLLDIRAERSNIGAAPADLGYTFQTQRATTQVIVEDGQTIVIGGLTITEKTKSRAGIPLLMDLPVIGALFRNESDRENKRDLLIMVTPHIVRQR